jgi:hypothetical protein
MSVWCSSVMPLSNHVLLHVYRQHLASRLRQYRQRAQGRWSHNSVKTNMTNFLTRRGCPCNHGGYSWLMNAELNCA